MEHIRNVKVRELLKMPINEALDTITAMRYVKPLDTPKPIFNMTLRQVQNLKDLMSSGTIEDIISCVDICVGNVDEMRILDFFKYLNSIKEQLESIAHAESVSLSSDRVNFKWEAVEGSEKMSRFGIYNTLENLSGGDVLKWEAILDLEYADVFTKLYMDKVKADLESEMNQLKTQQ